MLVRCQNVKGRENSEERGFHVQIYSHGVTGGSGARAEWCRTPSSSLLHCIQVTLGVHSGECVVFIPQCMREKMLTLLPLFKTTLEQFSIKSKGLEFQQLHNVCGAIHTHWPHWQRCVKSFKINTFFIALAYFHTDKCQKNTISTSS